jgi:RsiW-degrading membrane proteinase PrsW (M82 family)
MTTSPNRLRRFSWRKMTPLFLVLTSILFVIRVVEVADGDWGRMALSLGHHAWLLGLIMVVSLLARGRSLINVIAAFYGGFFTAIWAANIIGSISAARLGASNPWHLMVAVPIIEETVKTLPLLLVAWIWLRRRLGTPGVVDLGLLGTAVGAGFAVHEDAMWQRLSGSGFDGVLGWLAPSFHTEAGVVMGHAGWTGLFGIGLGIWLVNTRRRWTIVFPLVALAVSTVDHGLWNDVRAREAWRPFLIDGWLPIGLYLGGLLVAVVIETRVVQRRLDGQALPFLLEWPGAIVTAGGPIAGIRRGRRWGTVLRAGALASHRAASIERGGSKMASPALPESAAP